MVPADAPGASRIPVEFARGIAWRADPRYNRLRARPRREPTTPAPSPSTGERSRRSASRPAPSPTGCTRARTGASARAPGVEFGGQRPYVPGDDLRFFDRRALLRHDKLMVREFETETDRALWLCLDATASMSFRGERRRRGPSSPTPASSPRRWRASPWRRAIRWGSPGSAAWASTGCPRWPGARRSTAWSAPSRAPRRPGTGAPGSTPSSARWRRWAGGRGGDR